MDIYAVCEGLADAIRNNIVYQGGQVKVTVYPFCPDSIVTPAVIVADWDSTYDVTMNRGVDKMQITIRALISRSDDISAAKALAAMFSGSGEASLKAAIEEGRGAPGQPTFPGTDFQGACDDYRVVRMQANRWYDHNNIWYLGGEIIVDVIGSGG